MMAVPIAAGTGFQAGTPTKLFTAPHLLASECHHAYDISLNDQQFIVVRNSRKNAQTLGVVVNWGAEIKAHAEIRHAVREAQRWKDSFAAELKALDRTTSVASQQDSGAARRASNAES